jgi:hypothetical protein
MIMILVTPKAGAKHEFLFKKPVSASAGLLNKRSCLATALGFTELTAPFLSILPLFFVPPKSDLDVQQP